MSSIHRKGIIQGGQVVVEEPIDLPDGSEVTILADEVESVQECFRWFNQIEFMTEDEQGDDPETIQRWLEDLHSIPAVPEEPEREALWRSWDESMRQFNLEAIRKQFEDNAQ